MSKQLIERLRRGRELRVEVAKTKDPNEMFVFIVMRPTNLEMSGIRELTSGEEQSRRLLNKIVGWENVTEDDLVGGALHDPVKFDPALWLEWVSDKPELWAPIGDAIFEAYNKHLGLEAEAAKN